MANIDFMHQYGPEFDIGLFIKLANINPAAQSLSRDLVIGAGAITIWMVVESRRLQMRHFCVKHPALSASLEGSLLTLLCQTSRVKHPALSASL